MIIDFFNCYLTIKRHRKKSGASGLPVITLFIYALFIVLGPGLTVLERIIGAVVAILLHLCIVALIPSIDAYFFDRRKPK